MVHIWFLTGYCESLPKTGVSAPSSSCDWEELNNVFCIEAEDKSDILKNGVLITADMGLQDLIKQKHNH